MIGYTRVVLSLIGSTYGYLFSMDPIRAENLLERKGPRRVGSLIFFGEESLATLESRKWSSVKELLARSSCARRKSKVPQVYNEPLPNM
jgi:hypothetical protein